MSAYRSFGEQTRHYFDRPHEGVPSGPLEGPSIWRGSEIAGERSRWCFELSGEERDEVRAAVVAVRAAGLTMERVDRAAFPLPGMARRFACWRDELDTGLGFFVLRGLPVEKLCEDDAALAFWGIGHHLGVPGAQNPQQELLGHVRDYGETRDNPFVRLYRTPSNIDFHCDAADVVGLLCLAQAPRGGESRIVSTGLLYNECVRQAPELVERLFQPFLLDGRGEQRPGARPYSELPPCRFESGRLRTFYHSEYFRSVERLDGVVLDEAARRVLDLYDAAAADASNHLDMRLEPGDMQFLSNHSIAHARTGYEDDPGAPRHLLRLWLSLQQE